MTTLSRPNYTGIPNEIFDYWLAVLSPVAFKVVCCLCRKILGWHKTSDTISKNQIMTVTGLSKNSVQSGLEELQKHGLVLKFQQKSVYGHKPNAYALNIEKPQDIKYQDPEDGDQILGGGRSGFDLGVGHGLTQGVGHGLTPQKKDITKERLTKEIKESAGKADASVFSSSLNYQTSSKDQGSFFSKDEHNITYNNGPTNNGPSSNKLEINISNNKLNTTNPKDSQTKSNSPPSQVLIERRQNVHTSDFQHQTLVEKHGKELIELSYDDLSLWKSNKTSKELAKATDYGRLTKWVINSVRESQIKEKELKQREERLKGKSYANPKDDIRKRQYNSWVENNGNPDDNPNILRF